MSNKDYYKILGVDENAKLADIQKIYRQLAMKYHPDRNAENRKQAEERFKEISEAYYVLSDEKRRQEYDMFRKYGGARMGSGGTGMGGGFQGAEGFDFEEILRHFGGQGGGGMRFRTSRGGQKASQADFEDIFDIFRHMGAGVGGAQHFGYPQGANDHDEYSNGYGQPKEETDFNASLAIPKNVAEKGGEVIFNHEGKKITLKIKPGTTSGQKLRIKDQGKVCGCCGKRGDLIITIRPK